MSDGEEEPLSAAELFAEVSSRVEVFDDETRADFICGYQAGLAHAISVANDSGATAFVFTLFYAFMDSNSAWKQKGWIK